MKERIVFLKIILILLLITILSGCTEKFSSDKLEELKLSQEDDINIEDEYLSVDYEELQNLDNNLEIGAKIFFNGHLMENDGVTVYDMDSGQYIDFLSLDTNESITLLFMNGNFSSESEAVNYECTRLDEIRGKQGKFYLEYLGNMENGNPVCLLEKAKIENKEYDREYLGDISNIIGTINNPAKIGDNVKYECYNLDNSLEFKLIEVVKGEEAKNVIQEFDKSNNSLIKDKEIIMAKFNVYNSGEPFDINHLNFKYANESLVGESSSPYLRGIKNEMNFTIFSDKEAEGWIIFEMDPMDTNGYAIFNKELWFELF